MNLPVTGPFAISDADIAPLNSVFSEAFTERYRRDGMVGVRVPTLNPDIWRFALDDADGGAMLWRDPEGRIAAFNVAHRSGIEGWMGPLAVRTDLQAVGIGRTIVQAGVRWLQARGARVIGLETMPRTVDNIGFYTALGFRPGALTVTATLEAAAGPSPLRLGRLAPRERDAMCRAITSLTEAVAPGVDFAREIALTETYALGDTVLLTEGAALRGFAVCHAAALVEGRAREELRVLKVVLADEADLPALLSALAVFARETGTRRAAIRVQTAQRTLLPAILACGGRARWTDLRMTLDGFGESPPRHGVVLSNWEI